MRKVYLFISVLLLSFLMAGCLFSSGSAKIGEVTGSKTDEEAIREVVNAYLQEINNYSWDTYDKTKGLEFWTEDGKNDLLNDKNKLPYYEKSIKENEISYTLLEIKINEVTVHGSTASVEAITSTDSSSISELYAGRVGSNEKLTLQKSDNQWRISSRSAAVYLQTVK